MVLPSAAEGRSGGGSTWDGGTLHLAEAEFGWLCREALYYAPVEWVRRPHRLVVSLVWAALVISCRPAVHGSDSGGATPTGSVEAPTRSGKGSATATAGAGSAPPSVATCPLFRGAEKVGTVGFADIGEASGLAASRASPGVLWVHNDSGDAARIFAISRTGRHLATYSVLGAKARDWEDLELGTGPSAGRDYLYIGDIGDNELKHPSVVVYRVEEPTNPQDGDPGALRSTRRAQRIQLRYPDGAHDAEALLVDPRSGDLFIVTKERKGAALVYRLPAPLEAGEAELERVAEANLPAMPLPGGRLVTAGTISRDGGWVLLKTYTNAYLWKRSDGPVEAVFRRPPCAARVALEPQGESIAFLGPGLDYLTLSEGRKQPLYLFAQVDRHDSTGP